MNMYYFYYRYSCIILYLFGKYLNKNGVKIFIIYLAIILKFEIKSLNLYTQVGFVLTIKLNIK